MPDLSITGAGDVNIAGDAVGHDKRSRVEHDDLSLAVALDRVRNLEKRLDEQAEMIGHLQSKVTNVSTGLVVNQERITFVVMGGLALIVLSGLLSIVVSMVMRP